MTTEFETDHEEALEALTESLYEYLRESSNDVGGQMSEDALLQEINYSKKICVAYDVPQEERLDLICEGFRRAMYKHVDDSVRDFRWTLEMFRGL